MRSPGHALHRAPPGFQIWGPKSNFVASMRGEPAWAVTKSWGRALLRFQFGNHRLADLDFRPELPPPAVHRRTSSASQDSLCPGILAALHRCAGSGSAAKRSGPSTRATPRPFADPCFSPAHSLFGVTTLDVVRASTFIAEAAGKPTESLKLPHPPVVGGHSGVTIVPLLSQSQPPISVGQDKIEQLTNRIQFGGDEVVKAKDGAGSATLSMAYAGARFAIAVLEAASGKALAHPEMGYVDLTADAAGAKEGHLGHWQRHRLLLGASPARPQRCREDPAAGQAQRVRLMQSIMRSAETFLIARVNQDLYSNCTAVAVCHDSWLGGLLLQGCGRMSSGGDGILRDGS
ncbi:hypothetical protein L1887_50149 [Cichorium endivia]|nr:hypothetical protein L1887_50149 [Cichorium endivia]